MSSPAQKRQSSSSSGAPRRAADPSSQLLSDFALSQRGTRQPVPSSSPMNFRSSPVPGMRSPGHPNVNDVSDDDGTTPRARQLLGDSSPMRYDSSSVAGDARRRNDPRSESSGIFVRSSASNDRRQGSHRNQSRRGDINSDSFGNSTARPSGQLFLDEAGNVVRENITSDAPSFNINGNGTSEADVRGGTSSKVIWGTTVSVDDTGASFRSFLRNFTKEYRLWLEGITQEETADMPDAKDKEYLLLLQQMLETGGTALNLDAKHLKAYGATEKLWHQLQSYPQEIIPLMDQQLKDTMLELAVQRNIQQRSTQSTNGRRSQNNNLPSSDPRSPQSEGDPEIPRPSGTTHVETDYEDEVASRVYKVRPFGLDQTINLRDLNPSDMDKLVSIKGLVIRTTSIIPDMKQAFFKCQVCNHGCTANIDRGKIVEPTSCPRAVCKSPNSMQIVHNRSLFADKQVIKLQETPDSVPAGQTPHSVSLCAYDELVDMCKAGDRVEITGIFRSSPVRLNPRQRTLKSVFKTYVDTVHIQKVDKKRMGIDASTLNNDIEPAIGDIQETRQISEEEEQKIKDTAARPDIYELLSRSLAPSIFEMDDVKKGILLQLFGGTNKSFEKGGSPKYRGDINVLLCGDPSTSKSQLLKYVHKIAPRGVYTSGKGSSAVGLTAYVTRDPETRQLVLESGALVLSDGGVCCIDEFDKMSDATRSVLHEVMEQQTVSIAKAGIITTLNARTSILASANPIGSKYNPNLPVPQNIDLPPTLLSRFDLVYLILDQVNEVNDRRLARHLLGMYLEDKPENASAHEILPVEFLTSYISYARSHCQPRISEPASRGLVNAYVEMRKLGEDVRAAERRITATTRQLESMIRLAEAHAKMRLSDTVTEDDVLEAVRLIKSALKQAATDARTGLIDMSLLTEGTSASERRRREDLKRAVLALLDDMTRQGQAARYSDVIKKLGEQSTVSVEGAEFAEAIRLLEIDGAVLVVGEGARKSIRRVTGTV